VSANPSTPLGELTDVDLEPQEVVMLASAEAIATCARLEQHRLRALVAQGTATPRQILPFLTRLERLAIHGAQLTRQLQWLDQDLQRHRLNP
jgi:hypothetical protein